MRRPARRCARNAGETAPSPRSILGATLNGWFRSDLGVTTVAGAVSQWNDQSGRGNHHAQATVAKRPALVASVLAGKPAVRFAAASTQYLTCAAFAGWPAGCAPSVFIVGKFASNGNRAFFESSDATGLANKGSATFLSVGTMYARQILTVSGQTDASSAFFDTGAHLFQNRLSGGNVVLNIDNAQALSAATAGTLALTQTQSVMGAVQMGAAYLMDGDIYELVLASAAPTTAQRDALVRYFNKTWGLSLTPP